MARILVGTASWADPSLMKTKRFYAACGGPSFPYQPVKHLARRKTVPRAAKSFQKQGSECTFKPPLKHHSRPILSRSRFAARPNSITMRLGTCLERFCFRSFS